MGSKGSSSSSFSPPKEVVDAYREALGYGRAAMGQEYAPYTGEITAPLTPTQESGIYNVNRAVGTAIPYFGQATGLTADVAGRTITPQQFSQQAIQEYMSPYTSAVANSTFANLREQQKQEQEGMQTGAIRAGAFGGDRAGIASANLARQQDLATAQAMSNIYNQGYGQAVGLFSQQQGVNLAAQQADALRQLQAAQQLAGLGTGLQSSVLQGAQAQLAAGAQQQAVQQAINSGYYNQYLAAQAYPYQQAQFFANLATGVGGQMGGTTTGTPAQPSPAGSIFGALGALGSIFSASDKRVKENIKPIGKTNDGQTIYRYNFKGDPATQIGLIAQEVEKKHPEAVRTINGVKGVDYKEATDDSVRSMGGGVVPSGERKNFSLGGPKSLDTEEDPMIPYKAGVPSKVLQIPKLAKIGGTKPNFGGTPPGPVQGPSEKDWKGASEGLGKLAKKYDLFGSKETTPDADSAISGISDWLKANGGPVYPRPRFENGEEVPVTADTKTLAFNPDRDRADIVRPSYDPDVDRVEPMRVASFGNVARSVDAGIPSSEPAREAARPQGGVVPSMARSNTDLPPLFQAATEAVKAEPEEKEPEVKAPGSIPSMARADSNVQPVQTGLGAAAKATPQMYPLTPKERDDAIRTTIGEAANQPYEGKLGVLNVIRNRQLAGRYGKTVSDIVYAPKQFSVWNPGDPAGVMARKVSPDSPLYKEIGEMVDQLWSGEAADPTKGATHFANVARVREMRNGVLQPWLQGMIDSGKTIQIGAHTFGQADAGAYNPRQSAQTEAKGSLGDAQMSYKEPQTTSGEAQRTKIASAGENWPGFGVAGGGKRSIIESLMGKDLDPIQKRALFSFFAGMAASPSPWFGQQLGAGMQAASNVYNDSLNKQAELDVKGQELGLQKERVGLEERRVGVEERAKGLELLKFWQTRFVPQASLTEPGVINYRDTTTGQVLTKDEYNQQLANVMRTYNLSPSDVSTVKPAGLAPAGKPAETGVPSTGLVPPPAQPAGAEPKIMPGAETKTSEAAPMTMPKGTVIPPAPALEKKPAAASNEPPVSMADVKLTKPEQEENKKYQGVADAYNPILLDRQAAAYRQAAETAITNNLPAGKDLLALADERSKKAQEIRQGDRFVEFTDGREAGPVPSALTAKQEVEAQKKFQEQNLKDVMEWRKEAGPQLQKIPKEIQTLDNLAKVLEKYSPDLLGEQKKTFTQFAASLGIPVPESAMQDATSFYQFIKNSTDLVYDRLEKIGGRILQTEVLGITAAMPGPTMTPEGARSLVAKMKGAAEYTRQYYRDLVKEVPTGPQLAQFDKDKWIDKWTNENSLKEYIDVYDKEIAVRGGTPQQARDLEYGRSYILNPGEWNNNYDRPTKVKFLGFKKDEKGGFGPYFELERRK